MRHFQFSPVQVDIKDLFPQILNAAENVNDLENTRDYGSTIAHKNSNTKYARELYRRYWKFSKGILKIYKLPEELKAEIAKRFSWLEGIGEEPKISLQIISGGSVCVPHKDEERRSSILISINDDVSYSEFYDEKIVEDQLFPNPENISLFASVRFSKGENWLFNHKSVHGVQMNQATRVTVAVGFNEIDYETLCNFVDKYSHELVQ